MATPRDRVIEVLQLHQPSHIVNSGNGTYECLCDAAVPVPGGFDNDAYPIDWEAMTAAVCAHQADMLAAAGLVPETVEWGVRYGDDRVTGVTRDRAQLDRVAAAMVRRGYDAPDEIVHRYVTPWTTVEDPDGND